MEYRNPEIPEGINTSNEHPLREFFILVTGVVGLLAVVLVTLSIAAEHLAQYVPFSAEKRMASLYDNTLPADTSVDPDDEKVQRYLQDLANKLVLAEELEQGMTIKVHYVSDETVNAFATLGGHVMMFRGLLEKIQDENTLAMVMAHEIAHIKHRHPIKALGRAVIVGTTIGLVSSSIGDSMTSRILGDAGLLTTLKFSRDQENQSDNTAMKAMAVHYGHVTGADRLFEILRQEQDDNGLRVPQFLSTHPLSEQRIQNVKNRAVLAGWSLEEKITPLPSHFQDWLAGSRQSQQ